MFATKLTISPETTKGLNVFQIGELRFGRVKEAEKDGTLSQVKNRRELGYLAGYSKQQSGTANAWVNRMIKLGYISETIRYFENGKATYEYHLTGVEPDYAPSWHKNKQRKAMKAIKARKATKNTPDVETVTITRSETVEVVLSDNGRTICVKGLDTNSAIELIKNIWNN